MRSPRRPSAVAPTVPAPVAGPVRPAGAAACLLTVWLRPRADRNALDAWEAERLVARVTAPPVDGAANEALLRLLAAVLELPRSCLSIAGGATARTKQIRVARPAADIEAKLRPLLGEDTPRKNAPSGAG